MSIQRTSSGITARAALCLALAAVLLVFTGVPHAQDESDLPPQESETLSLAMSGAFAPFSTTDEQGNLIGFDADVATGIAEQMGREPELVQNDWAAIQQGLQTRKYDLICGSMAITDERREMMHFSLPYYVSGAQVYAAADTQSLKGLTIGTTADSTYAGYVNDNPDRFPEVEVVEYSSEAEMVAAAKSGGIDALVTDRIVGGWYMKKGELDWEPYGDMLYVEECGIAARKDAGGAALIERVNKALFAMLLDGSYAEIYEEWTGQEPDVHALLNSWAGYLQPGDDDSGD